MKSELEQFIKHCEESAFRNRAELLDGIRSGQIGIESHRNASDYPSRHFLDIYQRRAEHLQQFQTDHSKRLRNDVLEFVEHMLEIPDQRICGRWSFSKEPNITFSVFESTDTGRIIGCIKAVDKRLTSDLEWKQLWSSA